MILGTFESQSELLVALFDGTVPDGVRSRMALLLGEAEVVFFDSHAELGVVLFQALTPDRVVEALGIPQSRGRPDEWHVRSRRLRDVVELTATDQDRVVLHFLPQPPLPQVRPLTSCTLGLSRPVPPRVVDLVTAAR